MKLTKKQHICKTWCNREHIDVEFLVAAREALKRLIEVTPVLDDYASEKVIGWIDDFLLGEQK